MSARRKLDLVLINPSSRTQVYQSLGTKLAAVEPPVWAGLMATFCRRKGLSVAIIDAEAEQWVAKEVAERVEELNPVLAAVVVYGHQPSASTQIMTSAGLVCTAIKELSPTQQVLLVGGHVAALPEQTLREEHADFVAVGEGLHTLVGLVETLKTAVPELERVPGLGYRAEGRIRFTADRPLIADLDGEMPGVAWDLLPMTRYRAHNWHCLGGRERQPYAALYTTLGCPYHCSFCCIQAPFKSGESAAGIRESTNSYRYWNSDTVLSQIDVLVNQYGVRNLKIADEMFVLNRKHVLGICDGLIERGYDLSIWAYTRVDTIKEGMLEKLKAAGFNWLALGIEAGADRVRANVDKGFAQDEIYKVIARVRDAGIHIIGNYIFGLPEDDPETMQATLDLAMDLNCEFANFYSAMAYPGSPLYALAVRQAIPLPEKWTGYAQHSKDCLPLPTRYITARDVLQFRDQAFLRYYMSERYLRMAAARFGPETAAHIKQMTAYPLERDLLTGKLRVPLVTLPHGSASLPTEATQLQGRHGAGDVGDLAVSQVSM
jgi:anaerobic magnesium-protoporphyrin IX monomethyl ester cyclase